MMESKLHHVDNGAGWRLGLSQAWDPMTLDPARRPVAIIPGYGMNGFIFGYHPRGRSMVEALAAQGFEVWVVNLRNQEPSVSTGGGREYSLRDVSVTDLGVAVRTILEQTRTDTDRVDLIGASLGGTMAYVYLVLEPDHHVGSLVSIGGPLRWERVHPVLRFSFGCECIARLLPTRGTRRLAGLALPLMSRAPWLLSIYLHPELVDLSAADQLVRTVEDPNKTLNLEISRWIRERDLVIDGTNITEGFRSVTCPLLCVIANADGIVPPETAASALRVSGSGVRDALDVGTVDMRYAHADLFIGNDSERDVFVPIGTWLSEQR